MKISDDSELGYIIEADINYPHHLHDAHNGYPLLPESIHVDGNMISPYSRVLLEKLQLKLGKNKKLVPNLNYKQRYVLHYRNLKQCLKYGLELVKIHRVLEFKQSAWMKPYISLNTEMRKKATNQFEKDFYKLANNAVYGRTLMNVRKQRDVKIVTNQKTRKPTFQTFKIFNEDVVGFEMKKEKVKLFQPIYVGFTVLELSKEIMYDFHYGYMLSKYDNKDIKLLFTDTEVKTNDIYNDMEDSLDLFDTSEYPKNHKLYTPKNKKKLGKMKDETFGIPIEEFVGLRAKMYSLVTRKVHK